MTRMGWTAIAAALALGAAGCGGDDGGDEPEGATPPAAETTGEATTEQATPTALELTLKGSGKNITMEGPETIAGGLVEITLNSEVKEGDHSAQLLRVDGDQTAEEIEAAGEAWGDKGKALPEWLHLEGGVTAVPGGTATATQILEPGRYAAVDISSGISPSPAVEFEVTEAEGEAQLPETEGRVEMNEYSFTGTGLKAGVQQVLVENTGSQPHFIVGAPLAKGATAEDAKKFFEAENEGQTEGPPPVDFQNGFSTAVMDGGRGQIVDLDLKAGKYVFICFVPDRAGGPPHVAKGMVSEITVG